ncbi:hypothetical protein ABLO26_13470 [Neobacillus sp. 179-J 1A1 HS]
MGVLILNGVGSAKEKKSKIKNSSRKPGKSIIKKQATIVIQK